MPKRVTEYFSHDYRTREDPKVELLEEDYGMTGYGTWWAVVEICYDRGGYIAKTSISPIAKKLKVKLQMLNDIMTKYGLFRETDDGHGYTSDSILRRLSERDAKSAKAKAASQVRWGNQQNNSEAKQFDYDSNANGMQTHGDGIATEEDSQCEDDNKQSATMQSKRERKTKTKTKTSDGVVNNSACARESTDVEKWITSHMPKINYSIEQLVTNACYKNTEIMDFIFSLLINVMEVGSPVKVKNKYLPFEEVKRVVGDIDDKALNFIVQGFYEVDEVNKKFIRRHVSDPISYLFTILLNRQNPPTPSVRT